MKNWLLLAACLAARPALAASSYRESAAASPIIALAYANPDFKAALRAGVDGLPSHLHTPSMGLDAIQSNVAGALTAQEAALALFARPEVLWYHRDEFVEILGKKRLRNLEFAVETYHEAALKDDELRRNLIALGDTLDLTDHAYVDELALALNQAFEKSSDAPQAAASVHAPTQTATPQALEPSRPREAAVAQEPPEPDVDYNEHFVDSFEIDEETDRPQTFLQALKPYLPVALIHMLMDEDEADGADLAVRGRSVGPGPYGAH